MTPEDQELQDQALRPLFGRDIDFDLTGNIGGDFTVNAAGDWAVVEGEKALRQAITRRLITSPGEWATLPDYGCGLRAYVKSKLTSTTRDTIISRIKAQLGEDDRIIRVERVDLQPIAQGDGLQVTVVVTQRGRSNRNTLEVRATIT